MPGPYGVTPSGFNPKPLEDIKTELETAFRGQFGQSIDLDPRSFFGQLVGIFSETLALLWALGLAIYSSSFRGSAKGASLDRIGALTNTARRQASFTRVIVRLIGANGTVIPPGRTVSNPGTLERFTAPLGGTIAAGFLDLEFVAQNSGRVLAPAGSVTQIDTPVSGWSSASNPLDAVETGLPVETDPAYRARQAEGLQGLGGANAGAVRAKIQRVAGVTLAYVFENENDAVDTNGVPAHAIEAVVVGGTNAAIAQAILDSKATGCGTFGTTTQAATDANGFTRSVRFSRPALLNAWVTLNLRADIAKWQPANEAAVKQAVADYGVQNLRVGSELRSAPILPSVFALGLGVLDSDLPLIGLTASPSSTATVVASNRQIVALDTSRVVVNVTLISES